MSTKDEKKSEVAPSSVSPYALLIELEGALTGGRRMLFETYKKLLKKEKLGLDEATFIRHALNPAPQAAIANLIEALDGEGVSTDKLQAALLAALTAGDVEMAVTPALRKLAEAARKQNLPIVALSCLPEEVAEAVLKHAGLGELGIKLHVVKGAAAGCPCKGDLADVCRTLSRNAHRCLALVSTGAACHAALSMDLRVIAVADEFTTAQDFGGAEAVYESPADLDLADLFARLPAA